jgi:hypothetical protein
MEILNSGSFINLENQEKIEQLKYTAIELANAASSTADFTNEEEAASKLALEFWQGLEYMCRESERGAIQNIFTGEFLEQLRQLRPGAIISEIQPSDETPEIVPEQTSQTVSAEDEFLGVLAPENQDFAAVENKDEIQEIPVSEEVLTSTEIDLTETGKSESVEFAENESDPAQSEEIVSQIAETKSPGDGVETEAGLSLPEKEPYQFNKCTVTATIQLLPEIENSETRKAVLSVRTHDFAPNISLVEVSANNLTAALAPEIEKVLAQYQSDLPFKVMDKMKKEKAAPKRNTPKVSTETKSVSQAAAKPKEATITPNTLEATAQTNLAPAPQTAETGMQGSLFAI